MLSVGPALRAGAFAMLVGLSGCMGIGSDSEPAAGATDPATVAGDPAAATAAGAAPIVVRERYCPELRVREGTQVLRRYEKAHDEEPAHVIWQASIGNTARSCTYDGQGNMTIKIGISGRVIAGPKGGPGTVSAPVRIAVVKYQEAVLFSEVLPLSVAIPPENSALFSEVRNISVPSPGSDRDYIIFVGFDDGQPVSVNNAGTRQPERPAADAEALPDAGEVLAQ